MVIIMSRDKNVEKRSDAFVDKTETKIWCETPAEDNPYNAGKVACYGYDLHQLAQRRSFSDMLYLLLRGDLPDAEQAAQLDALLILFANPGPRHHATRGAMMAAVSKTNLGHVLPVALSILSASDVEDAIRFLRKNVSKPAVQVAEEIINQLDDDNSDGDRIIAPGFGSSYGSVDPLPQSHADFLCQLAGDKRCLHWGQEFAKSIQSLNMGWLATGVIAAVLADLGFKPQAGRGLYQLICAPGILAHGVEMAPKPITAMPFIADENYVVE